MGKAGKHELAAALALLCLLAFSARALAQDNPPPVLACNPGTDKDCYWAERGKVFCLTPDEVEEQTGHGKDKAYLDSLGCMELQRRDVTMLKLYDEMGIWKVYILGKVMWTWQSVND